MRSKKYSKLKTHPCKLGVIIRSRLQRGGVGFQICLQQVQILAGLKATESLPCKYAIKATAVAVVTVYSL